MLSPYLTSKVDGKVASTFPALVDTSMSIYNDVVDMPNTHLKHRSINSETNNISQVTVACRLNQLEEYKIHFVFRDRYRSGYYRFHYNIKTLDPVAVPPVSRHSLGATHSAAE
jgi:hypothetical protein